MGDVELFVLKHAPSFAVACPDGSHPHAWNDLHREYKALFDAQLDTILEYHMDRCVERNEFLAFCAQLAALTKCLEEKAEVPGTGGVRVADFDRFMEALTASEVYETFLGVMFQEVAKLQLDNLQPPLGIAASSASQEILVNVPEGYNPGHILPVNFCGQRYELAIPDGCGPGSAFRATVPVMVPTM